MDAFQLLTPTVILLSVGFAVILICRLLRISPIIGFLIAGLVLGPYSFALIEENETTKILAKLGVVFLLFDIGLHFSMKSAWKLRTDLLGLAPLQMLLTGILLAFTLNFVFGIRGDFALLGGFALALSSTAVVMQLMGEMKQTESPVGESAKAVLIFQDIVAVFLLIFADAVGGDSDLGFAVMAALFKTVLATFAAILVGRFVFGPLMKIISKYNDPEMFTVLGLAIVMLTALATESVGLSLTLGAFLAGMVLAETPFRALLQNELRPFRSLLIAFFFITIGMLINPAEIWAQIDIILGIMILLITLKAVIFTTLSYVFGRPTHQVIQLSFFMAQGSEFALVVFAMASVQAGIGDTLTQNLIAAIALSMMATPLISTLAYRWSLEVCDTLDGITNCPTGLGNPTQGKPVFIIGMNEIGKTLARAFKAFDIPYIAVDSDRKRFLEATAAGYIVAFGKSSDLRFWHTLGVSEAKAMCISMPDYDVAKETTPIVRKLYPKLKRYAAVSDSAEGVRYAALGAVPFHSKGAPPGLEMACFILEDFGIDGERVLEWSIEQQVSYLNVHAPKIEADQDGSEQIKKQADKAATSKNKAAA